ncbi:efflux RND transporter permease subunit [Puniceicoccaceae bacterium K14]|nr:efflux RND transporter permease subunit [Puniceicoccaceae bacterium K14]
MISWFTRNGVAANLLMLLLIIGGAASYFTMKRELFPQFSLDMVNVRVPYPGASPDEVEESIVIRIEEALQGIDGIKEMNSVAQEGYGSVSITVDKGYNLSEVKDDIKTRVDAIPSFPEEAERPVIDELLIQKDVIRISVFGDASEKNIKKIADRVRDDLVALDGISQAEVQGTRDYEISIEVSEDRLRQYGLSFNEVVQAVRENSLDVPGGLIKSAAGEIQLRTKEQAYLGEDFEKIVLLSSSDGGQVTLGQVATKIDDGFAEQDIVTMFNDKPAAIILVTEVGNENPLEISQLVYDYVDDAQASWVPNGIELEAWSDSSFYLQGRIDMLVKNGIVGFILVLFTLAIFLRPSLSFFVAIGIPVSFLATFAVAPFIGITINLLSLFAFILVLGIVVDDAIVVGESVFTEFQKNGPGPESAIRGTHIVATPVTFAILTTIVAFFPVFLLPGTIGKFMAAIPLTVIPTLLFSLVQSKLVLPYHLSLCSVGDKQGRENLNFFSRFQRKFSDGLERFIKISYAPKILTAIRYRYTTLATFIAFLILMVAFVSMGLVRFVFFPNVPSDYIFMELSMAEGTPLSETKRALDRIEKALSDISQEEIDNGSQDPIKNKGAFLGYSVVSGGPNASAFSSGSNIGSIILELSKGELRDSNADEISKRWREKVGEIPGARKLTFLSSAAGPVGLPVDVRLSGRDFKVLKTASLEIQEELKQYEGLYDIRDNYSEGKREIKVRLKDSARSLGLSAADLGTQVRNAFYGAEAQRIIRDKEDIKVMVRYPREERESMVNLENMRVRAPNGATIPLLEVADIEMGVGYSSISRLDRNRTINIQADANKNVLDSDALTKALYGKKPGDPDSILGRITSKYPGVTPIKGGEAKDMEEAVPAMLGGAALVIVLIYTLLAIPFKSYSQPIIVISVIPFGVGGAILGHLITFQNLSLLSMLGIIAMAGVVVNDSLVLVERINKLRADGMSLNEAVVIGGQQRFRPIILTSITTFVGLVPILLERSLQAQFLIPMATSLAFGVLFATFITLLLVPCAYLILEDMKRLVTNAWKSIIGTR